MARVLRGGIYWADLEPVRGHEQGGRRPVLVLSHSRLNARLGIVLAAAITSQEPVLFPAPLSYELPAELLPKRSWALLFQLRNIAVERLGNKLATAEDSLLEEMIEDLLHLILL